MTPAKPIRRTLFGGALVVALASSLGTGALVDGLQERPTVERIALPVDAGPTVERCWSVPVLRPVRPPQIFEPAVLVAERFDDGLGADWYDNRALRLVDGVVEYRFRAGASTPESGSGTRIGFEPQASVRISYRVRYAPGWVGSGDDVGNHELYLLTTASGRYSPLARTALTVYLEQVRGRPVVRMQDGLNIGAALGPVSGCGPVLGQTGSRTSCYGTGASRNNVRWWEAPVAALAPGEWHTVEVELRLNDIGRANGVIRLEVDGTRVISTDDVVFRTAAYPDMRFNQLVIGPYMGRSPIEQSFQLDDLVVMEGLP